MTHEIHEIAAVFDTLINFDVELNEVIRYLEKKFDGILVENFLDSIGVTTE